MFKKIRNQAANQAGVAAYEALIHNMKELARKMDEITDNQVETEQYLKDILKEVKK